MNKFIAFFKLIRFLNLTIIFLTQIFCIYFFSNLSFENIYHNSAIVYLVLSTAMVAASGYIVNDYLDVNIDEINKPTRVIIGTVINRKFAILFQVLFNLIAILFALKISYLVTAIVFTCEIILVKYSTSYKKQPLIGNIVVALLCGTVVMLCWLTVKEVVAANCIAYSIFAAVATLSREIIKDLEDLKGDRTMNCRTLPVVIGIPYTKNIVFIIDSVLIFASSIYFYELMKSNFIVKSAKPFFGIYIIMFIVLPMFYKIFKLQHAQLVGDFSVLSKISKLILVAGILSMMFFS